MRKNAILCRWLGLTGMNWLVAQVRTACLMELRVLAYHRVMDVPDPERYPFDTELITATAEEFDWQMRYIKRNWQPVPLEWVRESIDGKRVLPRKAVLVTFDDGFEDNYLNAFPSLVDLNVPATMFITTGHIGQPRVFWYEEISFYVSNRKAETLSIPQISFDELVPESREERESFRRRILFQLKQLHNADRLLVMEELRERYPEIQLRLQEERNLTAAMSWDQVRDMARHGIEIGSHTVTHPILTRLTESELWLELVQSKEMVEREIGTAAYAIAYPNGGRRDFNEKVEQMAKQAGYHLGFSYIDGVNRSSRLERYSMKRLRISPINDRYVFAGKLAWPELV